MSVSFAQDLGTGGNSLGVWSPIFIGGTGEFTFDKLMRGLESGDRLLGISGPDFGIVVCR